MGIDCRSKMNGLLVSHSKNIFIFPINSAKNSLGSYSLSGLHSIYDETSSETCKITLKNTTKIIIELGKRGRSKETLNVLVDMVKSGTQPDTRIITALIEACS